MSTRPRFTSTEPARDPADEAAASAAARRLAVRVVAARSTGVEDCRELLDMLGLHTDAGLPGPALGDLTQYEPPIPGRP